MSTPTDLPAMPSLGRGAVVGKEINAWHARHGHGDIALKAGADEVEQPLEIADGIPSQLDDGHPPTRQSASSWSPASATSRPSTGLMSRSGTRAVRGDKRMLESAFREESLVIAKQLKAHGAAKVVALSRLASARVLKHRAVSAGTAGPRALAQWADDFGALHCEAAAQDKPGGRPGGRPGAPDRPYAPGSTDPQYPIEDRC